MPRDSVGAENGDSCEYHQGEKECYMPQDDVQDSVGTDDGECCKKN